MKINNVFLPGHFTQIVWKGSKEFGIGRSRTKDGKWLVVANFYPAGNFNGENAANVLPTPDGKLEIPSKDKHGGGKNFLSWSFRFTGYYPFRGQGGG